MKVAVLKKSSDPVTLDDAVPEILAADAFARAALSLLHEMTWAPSQTSEQYLARVRLGVLVSATAEAVGKLVSMIEIPAPRKG